MPGRLNKTRLASKLGIARSTIYYRSRKKTSDETDKQPIEAVMEANPSYGHKRIAMALKMNKKKVLRIMSKYGLKPRIRRFKKLVKKNDHNKPIALYDNIVYQLCPLQPNVAWCGDFTYIRFKSSFIYLATVLDLFTKEIIGASISCWHSQHLGQSRFKRSG
jgi:transposase InsO family protein